MWYPCPKCGKADSSNGESYCGPCEDRYHRELAEEREEQIQQLRGEMQTCDCEDGDCCICDRRQARIYELQGKHDAAALLMNM